MDLVRNVIANVQAKGFQLSFAWFKGNIVVSPQLLCASREDLGLLFWRLQLTHSGKAAAVAEHKGYR